jgi:hypothetical protein
LLHVEWAELIKSSMSLQIVQANSLLNYRLSKLSRLIIPLIWIVLPVVLIVLQLKPGSSIYTVICFGSQFDSVALNEVKSIPHIVFPGTGYDGQFYAQLAIDPSLRNSQLTTALDIPVYRARRILLPALSYVLGLGIPWLILQAYATINLLFFGLLVGCLIYFYKPATLKDYLVITAIVWTTGALVSVTRALVDLPASVLTLLAVFMQGTGSLPVFLAAILCKETSALSLLSVAWPKTWNWKQIGVALSRAGLVLLPFLGWLYYVQLHLGSGSVLGVKNFDFPFVALVQHLWLAGRSLSVSFNFYNLSEILAPVSLIIQVVYFLKKFRFDSPLWRMGIVFAVLFIFLGSANWVQQSNYTRQFLPLSMAFNLLLNRSDEKHFGWWFVLGNMGLTWINLILV